MPAKLGQNFLEDISIVHETIRLANLTATSFVLEIGPGKGILTKQLAQYAKKIIAIEIDKELYNKLQNNFAKNNNIQFINNDILKINLPKLIKQYNFVNYKVIANIPYYITSPIIRLLLETTFPPTEIILMVQKEVAERIIAKPGQMNILALSVQYYADAKILFTIPRKAFFPIPKVDSALIQIIPQKNQTSSKEYTKKIFSLIHAGFSSKRKTLSNNLSSVFNLKKAIVIEKLKKLNLNPQVRAQELGLADWKRLVEIFYS